MTRVRSTKVESSAGVQLKTLKNLLPILLVVVAVLAGENVKAQEVAANGQRESRQTLNLHDTIELALKNNLSTLLASEREAEARGLRTESRAPLMPNISAAVSQNSRTLNLAALGLDLSNATLPGFPIFIGPFKVFDARVNLAQSIFNLTAIREYQAGKLGVKVAIFQEQLAREQVASAAALAYLNALRTARSVQTAQANLELAKVLATLAQNQRAAGVATGVDVTRALTRQAQEETNVAQAQTAANQAMFQLLRVAGLSLSSEPTLTDPLRYLEEPEPSPETAVSTARTQRREILVAQEQLRVAELETKAARAERLPSIDFIANYGSSGITPSKSDFPTRDVGVRVNVPIFNGGLTRGRIQVASSRANEAELQLASVRGQVEEDVRLAFSGLRTTAETVRAADLVVTLAERELEMARDRFRAGVADSIEVVTAQTVLANARLDQVSALAAYNGARLNLAAALGRAQTFRW